MVFSKPPTPLTTAHRTRLRAIFVACALGANVSLVSPAFAKNTPINVLVASPVAEPAAGTMSQVLWNKLVANYIGANVVSATAPNPTIDDCRKAGADYLVVAPFGLRPMLPGLANASGRIAARTHVLVTNCITGTTLVDETINIDSDPPSSASAGDFESVPEISWARSVPATLSKHPIAFERIAHIIQVNAPMAFVDVKTGVRPGDGLRDFSRSDHSLRAEPITLTVTQVFDRYVEVMFSTSGAKPGVGDLVEPLSEPSPTPTATTMPSPTAAPSSTVAPTPTVPPVGSGKKSTAASPMPSKS